MTRNAPLLEDLFWAGPRIFMKLGSYITFSDQAGGTADRLASPLGAGMPSDGSQPSWYNLLEPNPSFASATRISVPIGDSNVDTPATRLSLDSARGLGSVFGYATSKWAVSTIAMAIILNRTHIFAATRRRLRFQWHTRLLVRSLPIILLAFQSLHLLHSIQCQTSPNFNQLRWGLANKTSDLVFAHPSAFLNTLSSSLLFGMSDRESCEATNMIPKLNSSNIQNLRGSLSLLWPLFGVLCLSHFIETLSCAVQGRPLCAETGMTLFEQSLAFAEADAAVNNQLGWASLPRKSQNLNFPLAGLTESFSLSRAMILSKVNTPPEVLFIAFLSSMTHLSSHVLGIFDAQSKYRLANTGFWGLCFMATIVWSAFEFELGNPSAQSLLRFPTVCIIGFVPHVLVLSGIAVCLLIYGLALILSALAPPSSTSNHTARSWRERLAQAHDNMQANLSLSEIRITREMDFYTALLRTGFAAISMASEAVYLNEDRGVSLQQHTWLEEARFREMEELQRQVVGVGISNSQFDLIGTIGLVPVKDGTMSATSGYGRERAAQRISRGRSERTIRAGTGATERSSRWFLAVEFLLSTGKLTMRVSALATLWAIGRMRIRSQPTWLLWLAQRPKLSTGDKIPRMSHGTISDPSRRLITNERSVSRMETMDVEAEFRRVNASQDEDSLDADLYKYWLSGGWWGSSDESGEYKPDDEDGWDTTSAISVSTIAIEDDGQGMFSHSEDNESATSARPLLKGSWRTPPAADTALDMSNLAKLLHPETTEEREEAQTLSAHLLSDTVMTRSGFRRQEQLRRSRVLRRPGMVVNSGYNHPEARYMRLNPEDEEQILEQILLSRRSHSEFHAHNSTTVRTNSGGEDGANLPCVVCQSAARTIIVWPCRCLSLCDDCRVSLAMNNFDKCVCCRRDVMSFSRIFVP
ncbi:ubiquitin-protein ligase (Asi3) [Pochonia chlamydosporia 170]|uniref:Ubiquitin-protein ligase (Asi3) n=1 Tax=Pochonia chlamydosporia 170 TaxID=1380566 RepID=A0A179FA22_METCM|nr:ubiquitin-protein ligase (Asi3) [Pochonia chlamydosporia 170]OAQ62257.1 ubiquitin-protein ligase (Asi3) [Pochonia chlamydosporia 170]